MKTPNGYTQIKALFGNPANADGSLNHAWLNANIKTVKPPDGWKLYYQASRTSSTPTSGIQLHVLLHDSFTRALTDIWAEAKKQLPAGATDDEVRASLHAQRLDQTGGGFNFRPNTSDPSKLSLHSYGIAIDWDPVNNPRQVPLKKTLPDWWFQIWANYGWHDGRHFKTPDPMHIQFATGA
jgi:hypothetical protein